MEILAQSAVERVGNALLERSKLFEQKTVDAYEKLSQAQKTLGDELVQFAKNEC